MCFRTCSLFLLLLLSLVASTTTSPCLLSRLHLFVQSESPKRRRCGAWAYRAATIRQSKPQVLHLLSSRPAGIGRPAEGTAAACDTASTTPTAATATTAPAATTASAPAPSGRRQPAALGAARRAAPGPGAASSTACAAPTEGTPCDHYGGQCRRAGEQALPALKPLRFLQCPEQQAAFLSGRRGVCLLRGSCAGRARLQEPRSQRGCVSLRKSPLPPHALKEQAVCPFANF